MAEAKTKPTDENVSAFLERVPDPRRRQDGKALCRMMQEVTGESPVLWGPSIVGFGSYQYRYASGHEGDAPLAGFSPRSKKLVVYLDCNGEWSAPLLARLGKHRAGKACLYIKSLGDVDEGVLRTLIGESMRAVQERYPNP